MAATSAALIHRLVHKNSLKNIMFYFYSRLLQMVMHMTEARQPVLGETKLATNYFRRLEYSRFIIP